MKKISRLVLCTLLLCGLYEKSSAILDLELTQGIAASIPISMAPFSGESIQIPGGQSLLDVINHDLQNSGECRVVNPGQNADYAVSGSITRIAADRYEIRMQLRSAFKAEKNSTLLEERFETNSASFRAVAHRISDDIYAKLTGIRGVFSTRIAYVVVHRAPRYTRYQLEVADADGFNPRVLLTSAEPIMSPTWSPDAKNIAYVSFEGHRAAIYLQNVATGQRSILSKFPGINGAPAFSPDGRQLALVLSTTGNPNIYLMNITGSQPHALTSGWAIDTEPAFSPHGRSLLFTSSRDGSPQIYEYRLSNGDIKRLSFDGNYNACATYTPDGRAIIMMHRDSGGGFGIARLDLASGQTIVLTQSGHDESPSIAPNGKMIIYATQYGGRGVLAQVSIDGRITLRLPAREGSVQEPTWSPFLTQ